MDPRNQPAQDDEDLLRDIRKILDDRHDADDPYERGFADKLYEDCEDPTLQTQQPPRRQQNSVSGPVIHAYNSDFRRGADTSDMYAPINIIPTAKTVLYIVTKTIFTSASE